MTKIDDIRTPGETETGGEKDSSVIHTASHKQQTSPENYGGCCDSYNDERATLSLKGEC